eukprot:scaffold6550_cov131-Isochrysis_galbana.AAC.19
MRLMRLCDSTPWPRFPPRRELRQREWRHHGALPNRSIRPAIAVHPLPLDALVMRPPWLLALAREPHLHRHPGTVRRRKHLVHVFHSGREDEQPAERWLDTQPARHAQSAAGDDGVLVRRPDHLVGDARLAPVHVHAIVGQVQNARVQEHLVCVEVAVQRARVPRRGGVWPRSSRLAAPGDGVAPIEAEVADSEPLFQHSLGSGDCCLKDGNMLRHIPPPRGDGRMRLPTLLHRSDGRPQLGCLCARQKPVHHPAHALAEAAQALPLQKGLPA